MEETNWRLLEYREFTKEITGPDGNNYEIIMESPIFINDSTGDKAGCTDKSAMNYCSDCNVSINHTCIYLAPCSGTP